ncbi:MAG: hypothetical protein R3F37_00295 [Candidatus Competibacteraceae bacterium]
MELARVEFDVVHLLDGVSGLFAEEAKRKGLVLRYAHSGSIIPPAAWRPDAPAASGDELDQ